MAQEIFKRYEIKYLLTFDEYIKFREALIPKVKPDPYGDADGNYSIVSLYFEAEDRTIYYETKNKLPFRQKLRLRLYNQGDLDSPAFLEIKQKYKNVVNKRRTILPLKEAYAALNGRTGPSFSHGASNPQILQEALHFQRLYKLEPGVIVSYERQAFQGINEPDLRITFDYNLTCRKENLRIEDGPYGPNFLDPNLVILEVKVSDSVPFWLARLLSEHRLSKRSVSKYCTSMELMGLVQTPEELSETR